MGFVYSANIMKVHSFSTHHLISEFPLSADFEQDGGIDLPKAAPGAR